MVKIKIKKENEVLDYFRSLFPHMPEYVLRDFIYKNYHHRPSEPAKFKEYYAKKRWVYGTVNVTMDIFTPKTRGRIEERMHKNFDDKFKNDAAKHDFQMLMLKYSGEPSKEPIILVKRSNGFDLKEGWHRTIQSLKLWPEGYKQVAWLEVPKEQIGQ